MGACSANVWKVYVPNWQIGGFEWMLGRTNRSRYERSVKEVNQAFPLSTPFLDSLKQLVWSPIDFQCCVEPAILWQHEGLQSRCQLLPRPLGWHPIELRELDEASAADPKTLRCLLLGKPPAGTSSRLLHASSIPKYYTLNLLTWKRRTSSNKNNQTETKKNSMIICRFLNLQAPSSFSQPSTVSLAATPPLRRTNAQHGVRRAHVPGRRSTYPNRPQ